MSLRANESFVHSLWEGPGSEHVVRFLGLADRCPDTWRLLDRPLRKEIQTFQQRQIAAAYAGVLGASPEKVARRQEFLLRTAITSVLFPLEELEDRLLVLLERRGLPAFFHHVVRELCDHTDDTAGVFMAADACRVAAFSLEDALRSLPTDGHAPESLLSAMIETLTHLQHVLARVQIPFGWTGIALLWVSATYGLGALPEESTVTEHYAEI